MLNIEKYLSNYYKGNKNPSLKAMKYFINVYDNFEKNMNFIHIAGTNGKGSCVETITNILDTVFMKCYNLISVSIPDNIGNIGFYTFRDCISLTTIELPSEITEIEYQLFYNCENLSSLKIPNKIRIIKQEAFLNCSKLTELTLPASLETIGEGAFNNCTNLNTIHCQATEPPLCNGTLGIEEYATLYVPKGTLARYKDAAAWKNFKEIIEE